MRPVLLCLLLPFCLLASCSADGERSADRTPAERTPAESASSGTDPLPPIDPEVALPIVFVHGFAGSAQQYESQAMRFVANGYPQERILAVDHDGAGMDLDGYVGLVDAAIDGALDDLGAEQVYLVGHSRGTMVSTRYLADPGRAAKVAKYVAIDGAPCPDAVPCIAPVQEQFPGQAHVEVATSPESFAMQFEFLVSHEPEVVDIVPQRDPVVIEGRAVNFPANTGRSGATLEIWEVDPASGHRTADEPHAQFELGEDGAFGPVELKNGAHYEYALSSPDSPVQHHLYLQPYVRSSHLVRLLSSAPDGSTRVNTNSGPDHTSLIAIRMREWYAEDVAAVEGDQRDVLTVTAGEDGEPVDVLAQESGNGSIGIHVHDDAATPGETTLGPLPYFSEQPFQKGVDVYLPAAREGRLDTITVTNVPRGDRSTPQTLNVPNWPSDRHAITVAFHDFPVDGVTGGG